MLLYEFMKITSQEWAEALFWKCKCGHTPITPQYSPMPKRPQCDFCGKFISNKSLHKQEVLRVKGSECLEVAPNAFKGMVMSIGS